MLFNSHEFILLFLPITLLLFFGLSRLGQYKLAKIWLVLTSLFFYGWWNPVYLALIIFSKLANYGIGIVLEQKVTIENQRKLVLFGGVALNLVLLGYFKYANFFVDTTNSLIGTQLFLNKIVLPLGISFFTFQQVAYLVDCYRHHLKDNDFLSYCLFVSFFPQLIAGPIVHHKDVMEQFSDQKIYRYNPEDMSIGLTIFAAGLFKKVIFADHIATFATPIFDAAANGGVITFTEAWIGALAYSLQLYFDFSGYSDMAIGASRMFGVKLPLNFNSPYKATSITDFWRRWHITLSNWLRDYLYIPLGGNRKGELRRGINLMTTMLLGGLWHGAGWTYVIWGGIHGLMLVLHRSWQVICRRTGKDFTSNTKLGKWFSIGLTFLLVTIAWVWFRAANFAAAMAMIQGMFGFNGISLPTALQKYLGGLQTIGVQFRGIAPITMPNLKSLVLWLFPLLAITFYFPNTQEWVAKHKPALHFEAAHHFESSENIAKFWQRWQWQPTQTWAIITALITLVGILFISQESEFIYFQF
jgi:alginate O-acetyltransferase complex protein AlgI